MKIYYDFHIHSALSPCGDENMTPNNIVNMAALKGLNAIAVTDHNSVLNCRAAIKAAQELDLCVLAGIELCTAEEIHVLCLFASLDGAETFYGEVRESFLPIKNKPDIFGRQLIMNENDEIVGEEDILLTAATRISVNDVPALVEKHGGIAIPAHIDRPSYSITAVFGELPGHLGFKCIEVSQKGDMATVREQYPNVTDFARICNSDAHYLENISEPENTLEVEKCTPEEIIRSVRNNFI